MPFNVLTTNENKKDEFIKISGDAGNFRSEILKSDIFHKIVIILVCKEHKFLIYLSQYMLLYVLNMSLNFYWHYKVI